MDNYCKFAHLVSKLVARKNENHEVHGGMRNAVEATVSGAKGEPDGLAEESLVQRKEKPVATREVKKCIQKAGVAGKKIKKWGKGYLRVDFL